MKKDFDSWNEKKKALHQKEEKLFYHEREIWWCALGINVGFEQDGSGKECNRPVLILKGLSRHTCLIVPLTTSSKLHQLRPFIGAVDGEDAHALLSQLRVVDVRRLQRKIGYLKKEFFEQIRKIVKDML